MKLEKVLENYGLNKKQADLYLACLELGSASVYKIAKKAGLPRSTCYEILEDLRGLGLVSVFSKKKVKYYSVESPKNIISRAKEKIEIFEKNLPGFNAIYHSAKEKPTVRYYQGVSGMKIILEEVLDEAREIIGFNSADDLLATMGDYWPKFVKRRIDKKIPARVILRESPKARERKKLGPSELREVRIIPANYEHHSIIIIWGRKIAMFSFEKDMMALVIESEELARTQKAMFNFMWDSLEEK
jgi:sugar-specific transcriptional regulator TrmB